MKYSFIQINRILISIIPISLIFSIFISDLILSLSAIYFLFYLTFKKKIYFLKKKEFIFFLFFYCILIIGSIFSSDPVLSLTKVIPYLRFGLFIMLIQFLFENDNKFTKYFLFSILISFIILFLGIILQFIGFELLFKNPVTSRYSSFFFDELILGSYIIKLLPISLALLFFTNSKKYLFIIPFLAVLMIFLSGERTALINFGIFSVLILFFTNILAFKKKILLLSSLIICFVSLLNLFPEIKFRLIDQTMYQLGIIEPNKDYVEFKVSEKPILAKKNGIVVYKDLIDGVSVQVLDDRQFNGNSLRVLTYFESLKDINSRIQVIEWKEKSHLYAYDKNLEKIIPNLKPRIIIRDENKNIVNQKEYHLTPNSTIFFRHGQKISSGDTIARIPKYAGIAKEEHFIPLKYYLMFRTSYKIFKDNLIFGTGVKSFRNVCKDERYYLKKNYKQFRDKPDDFYEGFTGVDGCSTHPHNYYVQILAETGFISFSMIAFCFIYFLYNFFIRRDLFEKIICSSIVVNLFPFIFSGSFFNNFISIMIVLPIAFSFLNKKNKSNKNY